MMDDVRVVIATFGGKVNVICSFDNEKYDKLSFSGFLCVKNAEMVP